MKECKCGETRQSMFYGAEKRRCINCRSKYNVEYYQRKRKQEREERKARQAESRACAEGHNSKFSSKCAFKRFCQARREFRGSTKMGIYIECKDCTLQDQVDAGFIPVNIPIMEVSLMAEMN